MKSKVDKLKRPGKINEKVKSQTQDTNNEIKLKRELGLLEAVAITVGSIIGSGIFISPKGIISHVGSVGLSLIIWVVCGFIAILGAFPFVELATTFPSAGGSYTYIFEAFGPCAAFLSIWSTTILFVPVANAILGLIVAKYITQPFFSLGCAVPDGAARLLAAAGITFLTFINCYDIRKTSKLINTFLFLKISAVVIIIIGGIYALLFLGETENFENVWQGTKIEAGELVLAVFSGSFAYAGYPAMTHMMEELKQPDKNMPRAILISMLTVICVYLMANVAYFSVLSPAEMIASDAVAVSFVVKLFGSTGLEWIVPLLVSLSTFGSLSVHIMVTSRQCLVGARECHLPLVLSFITTDNKIPAPAIIFLSGLSLLYLYIADVFVLITFSAITGGFFGLMVKASLLYLRWKKPDLRRPFKVYIWVPILYGIIAIVLFCIPIYTEPISCAIGAIITLTGLPVYYFLIVREKQPKWISNSSQSVTTTIQKILLSIKED